MFVSPIRGMFYILAPIATMAIGASGNFVGAFLLAFVLGNAFQCDLRKLIETGRI